jgi:pyruvate, orthophosphate dikinase
MVDEGLLEREEAVLRVSPEQVDFYLHPQFDEEARSSCAAHRHGPQRVARCGCRA